MLAMDYQAFRAVWERAFHDANLHSHMDRAEETIDIGSMSRTYSTRLGMASRQPAEPFFGSIDAAPGRLQAVVRWSQRSAGSGSASLARLSSKAS